MEETTKHVQEETFQQQLLETVSVRALSPYSGQQKPRPSLKELHMEAEKAKLSRARLSVESLSTGSSAPLSANLALQLDLCKAHEAYAEPVPVTTLARLGLLPF